MTQAYKNKFEVQFSGGDAASLELQKRIRSIEIDSEMDQSSRLKIQLSMNPKLISSLSLSLLPNKINYLWNQISCFQGELTQVETVGHNSIELTYQDILHRLSHVYKNIETKEKSLSSFLKALLTGLPDNPEIRFQSPDLFEEKLPFFPVEYRPVREVIHELGDFYGYTYFIRPSPSGTTIHFIRAGKSVNSSALSVQVKTAGPKLKTGHSLRWAYEKVAVVLADNSGETMQKQLSANSLKAPLSQLNSGTDMKRSFQIDLPEIDLQVPHKDTYTRAEAILPYQFGKKVLTSDTVQFRLFEPQVRVGDWIQIEDPLQKYQDKANYIVFSTHLSAKGSQPLLEVTAVKP